MGARRAEAEADALRAWIEAAPRELLLEELAGWPEEAVLEALRVRFRHDVPWFCAHCFPDLTGLPFNVAHSWILGWFASLPAWPERVRQGEVERPASCEAPRGLAKTTTLKMAIAHRIAYGMEPFILWGGPGRDEAKRETGHLRTLFEQPSPTFGALYGPFTVVGGVADWSVQVGQARPIRIASRSFPRSKVRGINHLGQRPTLIVADDLEHPEEVHNPDTREGLSAFLQSDVRNAGPKEGGLAYFQVGTRLHPDSQTVRNTKDKAFESIRFQAVKSWPAASTRWEQCRTLWADLTDPYREETARRYYERHRAEMDAGAEVLDPLVQPLFKLQTILWSRGAISFYKDYQNDAIDPERQVFDVDGFRRCRWDGVTIRAADGRRVALSDCRLAWWLDPRASEEITANDYAGGALVAVEAMNRGRYAYVLEALLGRVGVEQQLAWCWAMFDRYGSGPNIAYGYEDNGFQRMIGKLLDVQREERRREGRAWMLPLQGFTSKDNKLGRIITIAPHCALGWVQFAEGLPVELLEQFRQVPTGAHDDGPDAVERAIWLASSGGTATASMKTRVG